MGHFAHGGNSQVLPWHTFVINVSRNGKVKKLAYLVGCWLDLAQIWNRGVFLDSESKINDKNLI